MPELTRWKNLSLSQTRSNSCIAAGYEYLLRYAGFENAILSDFQQLFEFYPPQGRSTFGDIKDSIVRHYESNELSIPAEFKNARIAYYPQPADWDEKLRQINELLGNDVPCLAITGSHAAPVIAITSSEITFLMRNVLSDGFQIFVRKIDAYRADQYRIQNGGGTDIVWLP